MFWHYSGLAFIAAKASSEKNENDHPSLMIWLASIYVALYGFATNYYESRLDRIENRFNLIASKSTEQNITKTASAYSRLLMSKIPPEPEIFDPETLITPFAKNFQSVYENEGALDISEYIHEFLKANPTHLCDMESGIENAIDVKGKLLEPIIPKNCNVKNFVITDSPASWRLQRAQIHIVDDEPSERPFGKSKALWYVGKNSVMDYSIVGVYVPDIIFDSVSLIRTSILMSDQIKVRIFKISNSNFSHGSISSRNFKVTLSGNNLFFTDIQGVKGLTCHDLKDNYNAQWSLHNVRDCEGYPMYADKESLEAAYKAAQ